MPRVLFWRIFDQYMAINNACLKQTIQRRLLVKLTLRTQLQQQGEKQHPHHLFQSSHPVITPATAGMSLHTSLMVATPLTAVMGTPRPMAGIEIALTAMRHPQTPCRQDIVLCYIWWMLKTLCQLVSQSVSYPYLNKI